MVDGQPEGTPEVQAPSAPQSEDSLRESVIAHAAEVMRERAGEPEATGEATGEKTPAAADGTKAPEGADSSTPTADAPPLTDPAAFQAWLDARDARQTADHAAAMEQQKRSITGSFQAEAKRARDSALLKELDEMDPADLGERLRDGKDAEAASVLAQRAQDAGAVNIEGARNYALQTQAPMIFSAAEAIKTAGGPDINEVFADAAKAEQIGQHPAGVFGWLTETALETGARQGVEKFKASAEYRSALEAAADAAIKNAFPNIGTPPIRGTGTRPASTTPGAVEYADDRAAAVAAAARRMEASGRHVDVDPNEFARGRGRRGQLTSA